MPLCKRTRTKDAFPPDAHTDVYTWNACVIAYGLCIVWFIKHRHAHAKWPCYPLVAASFLPILASVRFRGRRRPEVCCRNTPLLIFSNFPPKRSRACILHLCPKIAYSSESSCVWDKIFNWKEFALGPINTFYAMLTYTSVILWLVLLFVLPAPPSGCSPSFFNHIIHRQLFPFSPGFHPECVSKIRRINDPLTNRVHSMEAHCHCLSQLCGEWWVNNRHGTLSCLLPCLMIRLHLCEDLILHLHDRTMGQI